MTHIRTPVSLNWLIRRRAKIDGDRKRAIAEQTKLLTEAKAIRDELVQADMAVAERQQELRELVEYYERSLKSLDDVLRLHEVKIDPSLIKAVKAHTSASAMGHGEMVRLIYNCLRDAIGEAVSTTAIAQYAWENTKSSRVANFDEFRFRLRKRLGVLAWQGRLVNVNSDRGVEGLWVLRESGRRGTQQDAVKG